MTAPPMLRLTPNVRFEGRRLHRFALRVPKLRLDDDQLAFAASTAS
jgi:hypothetical protein